MGGFKVSKMLSKLVIGFSVLVLLITISACGSSETGSIDGDTIKIGAIFPLSGSLALLGQESFRGVELAVEQRNKDGGIAGGKTIEVFPSDAPDPDTGQSETNRLINKDDIKLIVGSFSSGISFASSEVAERNGGLYWELGAVSDEITNRGYKSILRINAPASAFSQVHFDFIKEVVADELGLAVSEIKIAVAHEDSAYGTTIAEVFEKLGKENGLNIVTVLPYSSQSNDLSSVVLSLAKEEPDVLIAVSYLNDAVLLARQSQELGFEVPVFIGSGGGHTLVDYRETVGESADGILNIDFPQYDINRDATPGLEEFLTLYKEKYGTEPQSGHSLANFMGMNVVLDIIDKAETTDPDELREVAMEYKLETGQTATGWGVDFDPQTGQNKLAMPYVHQWIDGNLKAVWPEHVAVEEPRINR